MKPQHIAVIDIGKTNAKLALIDTGTLSEIEVVTQPNTVVDGPPYPHFDTEAIWAFLLDALAAFQGTYGIDAISVTTHGASGALLAADGSLAAPILDYEHTGPDDQAAAYDRLRPPFAETGAPRLPMGLNLGAQFHWQFAQDPGLADRTAAIVTYPQYWGHRLTGVLATDVTSIGCHTDLWNPHRSEFSSLVDALQIRDKIAPALKSAAILGSVRSDITARTGLGPDTPVYCGIHDSNASLLPHVMRRKPPFSVVSTGTWVIVMTMGGTKLTLDPARDTLVNVNALGDPVPSARFMGGREYELIRAGHDADYDAADLQAVMEQRRMLMPSVVSDCGPFQGRDHRWDGGEPQPGTPARAAVLSLYLAMMTAECLALTGHQGAIVVEGPFARNHGYCQMLAAATGCAVRTSDAATGTGQGAAMLALNPDALPDLAAGRAYAPEKDTDFAAYAQAWRDRVAAG